MLYSLSNKTIKLERVTPFTLSLKKIWDWDIYSSTISKEHYIKASIIHFVYYFSFISLLHLWYDKRCCFWFLRQLVLLNLDSQKAAYLHQHQINNFLFFRWLRERGGRGDFLKGVCKNCLYICLKKPTGKWPNLMVQLFFRKCHQDNRYK